MNPAASWTPSSAREHGPHRAASVLLLALFLFVASQLQGSIANVYVSQNGVGTQDGLTPANAKPLTFFNSGANWGAGAGQIGPDTVVHLTGTFTGSAGQQNFIRAQGSGTSGHPITILMESGAIVQAPYFSNNNNEGHAISAGGNSWITIDGGTNGIVRNTANGSSLANQQASILIGIPGGSNVQVKNLTLSSFVHVAGANGCCATWDIMTRGGTNLTIGPGNHINDADLGFFDEFDGGEANLVITGNFFNHVNQDIQMGPTGAATITNVRVDHNDATGWENWDDPIIGGNSSFHHNFFHPFDNFSGSAYAGNLQVYDNNLHGDMGIHPTSMIFIEHNNGICCATMGPWYIFNNIFDKQTTETLSSSGIVVPQSANGFFVNNTVKDAGGTGPNAFTSLHLYGGASGWTVKNNIFIGGNTFVFDEGHSTNFNNNVYYNSPNGSPFVFNIAKSFTGWQGDCGCDAASRTTNPNLSAAYVPGAGSSATGLGANLTPLGVVALDFDINGTARSVSGAWDTGAVVAGGAVGPPSISISPGSLAYGNQTQNTTNAPPRTVTITNVGGSTLTLSPNFLTYGGANGADWTRSGGTCSNNLPIAPGNGCTVDTVFRPITLGNELGTLTINSNASNPSAGSIPLTGTGVAPGSACLSFAPASPTPWDFGSVVVGSFSAEKTFTITNCGTLALTLSSPVTTFGGANGSDFSLGVGGGDTCSSGLVLNPGDSCTKTVRGNPSAAGVRNGTATIGTTSPTSVTIALRMTGTTLATCLSIAPAPVLFGSVVQGQTSGSTQAIVTNCGAGSVTLSSPYAAIAMVSPASPVDFANLFSGDCTNGKVLASAAACAINMNFHPSTAAAESATLTVTGSGGASAGVTLSGVGTPVPAQPVPLPWFFTMRNCMNYSPTRTTCQMSLPAAAVRLPGLTKGTHLVKVDGGLEIMLEVK